ncbi:hypothetical protein GOV14_05715 [Candidatus Pacearchaeota archaeon]|nr:hypothetical protein [Candidatus Pacearchaeota archaeon]
MIKKNKKKAQVGIEFIIVFGAVFFFFTILVVTIYEVNFDRINEKRDLLTNEVALEVQNEISLAVKAANGYEREFTLPARIDGKTYDVQISDNAVYVKTTDNAHSLMLPIAEVNVATNPFTLNTNPDKNKISKTGEVISITLVP